MKEFMLLIRNEGDGKSSLAPEKHEEFVKKCEVYINFLKKEGKLVAAQPLSREGKIISHKSGIWKEELFNKDKEIQVGYYHILANDMEEAISISKGNPEFEYNTSATIEVRPIKMKEDTTGFLYPKTT